MGADYILHHTCDTKLSLGDGDTTAGTAVLLAMLKAESRAATVLEMMQKDGQNPETASITMVVIGPDGPEERQVTRAELMEQAAGLADLAPHCRDCDACVLSKSFGCVGYLNYPITEAVERWIVERIQPASTLGGSLLLGAIADFHYDGTAMRGWRKRPELLELRKAPSAVVMKGVVSKKTVSTDQVLQTIFRLGDELGATHCICVLLWLGCVEINGHVPTTEDPAPFVALVEASSSAERLHLSNFDVGPPDEDAGIRKFQQLLFAMYSAWVLRVPLLMDA